MSWTPVWSAVRGLFLIISLSLSVSLTHTHHHASHSTLPSSSLTTTTVHLSLHTGVSMVPPPPSLSNQSELALVSALKPALWQLTDAQRVMRHRPLSSASLSFACLNSAGVFLYLSNNSACLFLYLINNSAGVFWYWSNNTQEYGFSLRNLPSQVFIF